MVEVSFELRQFEELRNGKLYAREKCACVERRFAAKNRHAFGHITVVHIHLLQRIHRIQRTPRAQEFQIIVGGSRHTIQNTSM